MPTSDVEGGDVLTNDVEETVVSSEEVGEHPLQRRDERRKEKNSVRSLCLEREAREIGKVCWDSQSTTLSTQ